MTKDVGARIARHNAGKEKTTKPYVPFQLIYSEVCNDRVAARRKRKILEIWYWQAKASPN